MAEAKLYRVLRGIHVQDDPEGAARVAAARERNRKARAAKRDPEPDDLRTIELGPGERTYVAGDEFLSELDMLHFNAKGMSPKFEEVRHAPQARREWERQPGETLHEFADRLKVLAMSEEVQRGERHEEPEAKKPEPPAPPPAASAKPEPPFHQQQGKPQQGKGGR